MKKLVGYLTAAFPDKNFSIDAIMTLKEAGVDSIEIGIPFSDPVADGPVIEEANLNSLKNGFKMQDLFDISKVVAKEIDTLWMGYFNPFYHKGVENSVLRAKEYKVSGFIIPDLPFEEAKIYKDIFDKNDMALIDFIAPTDSKERIKLIVQNSKKFIYLVAYAGITGAKKSEDLKEVIENIREFTDTPLYVGFGVSEKTAKEKAKNADGVIVGSTFVKVLLNKDLTNKEKLDNIKQIASTIKEKINE